MAMGVLYRKRSGRHAKDWQSPVQRRIRIPASLRRRRSMESMNMTEFELEIGIEELEPKIAPSGEDAIVPYPYPSPHHH
jgi:hypothetical protein